jgi:hypothetical protein
MLHHDSHVSDRQTHTVPQSSNGVDVQRNSGQSHFGGGGLFLGGGGELGFGGGGGDLYHMALTHEQDGANRLS